MAFCSNCGTELTENAKFCSNCGTSLNNCTEQKISVEEQEEKIILEEKVILEGAGQGTLILTNKNLIYKKSIVGHLAGGIFSILANGDTTISLKSITNVELCSYAFLGSAGILVFTNDGKKYRYGFYNKGHRDIAFSYLQQNH